MFYCVAIIQPNKSLLYFILNKSIPCGSKQEKLKSFSSLKPWNLHISHSFSFCLILCLLSNQRLQIYGDFVVGFLTFQCRTKINKFSEIESRVNNTQVPIKRESDERRPIHLTDSPERLNMVKGWTFQCLREDEGLRNILQGGQTSPLIL